MRRYGSRLYDQIEVYADPQFYQELSRSLDKESKIKCSYPLLKMEGLPQIIEIVGGFLLAIDILLKAYEIYNRKKPKVLVRLRNGKIIDVNSKGIEELRIMVEEDKKR